MFLLTTVAGSQVTSPSAIIGLAKVTKKQAEYMLSRLELLDTLRQEYNLGAIRDLTSAEYWECTPTCWLLSVPEMTAGQLFERMGLKQDAPAWVADKELVERHIPFLRPITNEKSTPPREPQWHQLFRHLDTHLRQWHYISRMGITIGGSEKKALYRSYAQFRHGDIAYTGLVGAHLFREVIECSDGEET